MLSSPSDDEVGALPRRDPRGASASERGNQSMQSLSEWVSWPRRVAGSMGR